VYVMIPICSRMKVKKSRIVLSIGFTQCKTFLLTSLKEYVVFALATPAKRRKNALQCVVVEYL